MRYLIVVTFLIVSSALPSLALSQITPSVTPPDWSAIKAELESMYESDQAIRNQFTAMMEASRQKGEKIDFRDHQALLKKMSEQDQTNRTRLDALIAQRGWPGQKDVGGKATTAAWLIIQHGDLAYQLKYIDMLRKAVKDGQLEGRSLALTEDRILVNQKLPQRYGSQVNTTEGLNLFPVEDEANLDARRKELGLPPICEYLQRFVKAHGPIKYPPCTK